MGRQRGARDGATGEDMVSHEHTDTLTFSSGLAVYWNKSFIFVRVYTCSLFNQSVDNYFQFMFVAAVRIVHDNWSLICDHS